MADRPFRPEPDEPPRVRMLGCLKGFAGFGVVGSVGLAVVAILAVVITVVAYQVYVVANPGPHLSREHVRSIIAQESPVYYADGDSHVGVFFEEEHRQFVPFEDLPSAYVMAIVAAEDGRFWRHWGVDPKGIARAMRDNISSGSVVAGGSTLTQQTAKNLYYRPDRSLRAKLVELLNALRLERHYDKAEILEFYVNQFHVSGNGRGLGIAARHFFDKEVEDLSVAECAFLAGLVKAPSYYDPFLGDAARSERAITRAHERTRYVLERIVAERPENLARPAVDSSDASAAQTRLQAAATLQQEATALLEDGFKLPFKRGSFRFESSAVLDEVARRLDEPPFDEILGSAGIESAETAGLRVITTLDPHAQREATYALWHHLTEVGTWMEALGPAEFVLEGHRGPRFDPDYPPRRHEYRIAKVAMHEGGAGKRTMRLDLGGHLCIVDREAVVRVAVASWRGKKEDPRAKVPTKEVDAFINAIPDESIVLASVREVVDEIAYCDLEVRPELQGAVSVVQDGQVRALVGGNDNRNFNRTTALRQFGSTWKPLVYHAAMKLGWQPTDVIDNQRNVFPFSTTFYYPRPDHTPAPEVSLAWAGVNSENLASIWLLYHLLDSLNTDQIHDLAVAFDMARREGEELKPYRLRVQEMGVLPTPKRVEEGLYLQARHEVLASIASSDHPEDKVALQSLLYGWNFGPERSRVSREGPSTRAWKQRALGNDWRTLRGTIEGCRFQYGALAEALNKRLVPNADAVSDLTVLLDEDQILVNCKGVPEGYVKPDRDFLDSLPTGDEVEPTEDGEDGVPADVQDGEGAEGSDGSERERKGLLEGLFGGGDDEEEAVDDEEMTRRERRRAARRGPQLVEVEHLRIDDRLALGTLEAVKAALERRKAAWDLMDDKPDLYDPEVLYWHQDFRVLLSMRYVSSLAEQYGVQTEVRQVLSMPLGASEITLEEAAILYTGLVSGTAWEFPGRSRGDEVAKVPNATLLIQEIRDVDGNVLYRAVPTPTQVAERPIGEMTTDILRNVVLHGTGRRAKETLTSGGSPLPVGGKTGTTNDFKNAAFLGYAPVAQPGGYAVAGGYVVGAYVGYDDNRSMSKGRIRLAGSSGALPAWMGTVQGLADSGLLGEPPTNVELEPNEAWPLNTGSGLARTFVDPKTGLVVPLAEETEAMTLVVQSLVEQEPDLEVPDLERPPRISPGTEEAARDERRRRRQEEKAARQAADDAP
ncbi:MAG: transglycosylase domain-containing protein [Myxococcales bacterium]|nr:transglycosylase domain-containing protein [Myxococcales bacterium]